MFKTISAAILFSIFSVGPTIAVETISPDMQIIMDMLLANDCSMSGQAAATRPELSSFEGNEIRNLVSEMIELGIVSLRAGDNLHLTDQYCPS